MGRFKRTDESAFNSSSGSDHSPEDTVDLSVLVASFIESEGPIVLVEINNIEEAKESSSEKDLEDVNERLRKLLEDLSGGEERMRIMAAMEVAGKFVRDDPPKRKLMAFLRNEGFDAGLCKSRWERFGKNTAGKYEYVDVRHGGEHNRYIVETNLTGEFEIARPTRRYLSILNQVPRVFVGTPEELKHLVGIMCHEMRRSMTHVGIHVPPWRRNGYMQAKWFGFYRRTTNEMGCASSSVETMSFKGCKDEFWKARDLKVMAGQLTVAFNT